MTVPYESAGHTAEVLPTGCDETKKILARERAARRAAERLMRCLAKPPQCVTPAKHQAWVRRVIAEYFDGNLRAAHRDATHPLITGSCRVCEINLYNGAPHQRAMPCNVPGCPHETARDIDTDRVLLRAAQQMSEAET